MFLDIYIINARCSKMIEGCVYYGIHVVCMNCVLWLIGRTKRMFGAFCYQADLIIIVVYFISLYTRLFRELLK